MIAEGFLLLLPSLAAIVQSLIVNIARAAEGSGKLLSLLISREESVFKRLLDYHGDILHRIRGHFNHTDFSIPFSVHIPVKCFSNFTSVIGEGFEAGSKRQISKPSNIYTDRRRMSRGGSSERK